MGTLLKSQMKKTIRCVIVGDGCVGKTCMLHSYITNEFPVQHVPTIFNNMSVTVVVEDEEYNMQLYDTAGQEEYDKLRVLTYPDTDVFILTYSVSDPVSLQNVIDMWVPELRHMCGGEFTLVLVGNKIDLRDVDKHGKKTLPLRDGFVGTEQGRKTAEQIGAAFFCECSALTQKGLDDVFLRVVMAALDITEPGDNKKNTFNSFLKKLKCFSSMD